MITKSDRLCLRYYIQGDEEDIFKYTSDIESSKYLARKRHDSKAQTKEMLLRLSAPPSLAELGKCIWIIANVSSQQAMGFITLVKSGESVELHIGLIRMHAGKGNASNAIKLASLHLIQSWKFQEVVSFTDVENIAAKAAFEKSGFSVVGEKKEFYVAPQLFDSKRDVFCLRYGA